MMQKMIYNTNIDVLDPIRNSEKHFKKFNQ